MRRNKFKAIRTAGFASKLESAVHDMLKNRESKGEIKEIKCQQSVVLLPGPRSHRIAWKVDFSFVRNSSGETEYCEAKGIETSDYKLKLKLWRSDPPAALEIWKGSYKRLFLAERIEASV